MTNGRVWLVVSWYQDGARQDWPEVHGIFTRPELAEIQVKRLKRVCAICPIQIDEYDVDGESKEWEDAYYYHPETGERDFNL